MVMGRDHRHGDEGPEMTQGKEGVYIGGVGKTLWWGSGKVAMC